MLVPDEDGREVVQGDILHERILLLFNHRTNSRHQRVSRYPLEEKRCGTKRLGLHLQYCSLRLCLRPFKRLIMLRVIGLLLVTLVWSASRPRRRPVCLIRRVIRKLCPNPNARCLARDNPEFYKDTDPDFYNRITKPAPRRKTPK